MIEIFKSEPDGKLSVVLPEVYEQEGFAIKDCWINLVNPSDKEVAFVSSLTGIEDDALKAPLDDEERSRIEQEEEHLMVLVDMPVIDEEDDYYSYYTIPVGTFIKQNVIVTVSLRESTAVRDFVRGKVKNFRTDLKTRFLYQMLYNIAARFLSYLKQIDKASARIQNELYKSTKNKELIQMLDLENSLVYFATSLSGNDTVITRLLSIKNNRFLIAYEEEQELLEDVAVETKQAIEMCTIYRDILSGTMDAYASVISNNQNSIMKALAIITLMMSIPTLVASFFGMNTWLPGGQKVWGFVFAIALSVILVLAVFLVVKKKKLL